MSSRIFTNSLKYLCLPVLLIMTDGWFPQQALLAEEVVATTGKPISIETGKGSLIRLDRAATTLFVADPAIADVQVKSPRLVYLFAKKPGQTSLFAVDAKDRVILSRDVFVSHNLSGLNGAIASSLPGQDIRAESLDGALVLKGVARDLASADLARQLADSYKLANQPVINQISLDMPTQIHLRVRVAEISRDVSKQLGFHFDLLGAAAGSTLGLEIIGPTIAGGAAAVLDQAGVDRLTGALNIGAADFNFILDALDNEGIISILAQPNLTALSGQTATFLAGGEFPIVVPQNNDRIAIEFKEFGVSLAFTPTLTSGNRINLHVRPEVSQLSTAGAIEINGFSIPSLTTRRTETTVELSTGQSFAIAGLMQNDITQAADKFPGLAEIPVFGALFRSDSFRRQESELVIVVTPYLVKPVNNDRPLLPTDKMTAPHDQQRIVDGATGSDPVDGETWPVQGRDDTLKPLPASKTTVPAGFRVGQEE